MADPTADACLTLLLADDAAARPLLEQAWQGAQRRGDAATARHVAALALLAIQIDFADFHGLVRWIERFESAPAGPAPEPGSRAALHLLAARLALPTLDHRSAFDAPEVQAAAAGLLAALREGRWPGGDEHALLAKLLHDYYSLNYGAADSERVAALASPAMRAASADWRARWWTQVLSCLAFWGHAGAAAQARAELQAAAAESGSTIAAWQLALADLRDALRDDDAVLQDRLYEQVDRLRPRLRPGLLPRGLHLQAQLLMRRGRHRAALDKLEIVARLCDDCEVPERDRGVYHELRAHALAALGRWDEALALLQAMGEHQTGGQGAVAAAILLSMRAARALQRGDADAQELALQTLRRAAALAWPRFLPYFPELAARLVAVGLEHGVETEFATGVVRDRRLCPPERWRSDWPWRLRVHVLGSLRIVRDGQRLVLGGKVPRKPLELLALLAAHPARELAVETAIDALWPSLDANAPRASFDMTLLRLRKLLDVPDAVVLAEGRLSLHPAQVWTDVGAFEALAAAATAGQPDAAAQALALVDGPLLDGPPLTGVLAERRQRLRDRHVGLALLHAQQLAQAGRREAALPVLQLAIERAPLAEPLYRALMQLQIDLGEPAEALRSFRHCRERLLAGLGVSPSAPTLALAATLSPEA